MRGKVFNKLFLIGVRGGSEGENVLEYISCGVVVFGTDCARGNGEASNLIQIIVFSLVMPRTARLSLGDEVYHVINRSNGQIPIFHTESDYQHFELLLEEGKELVGMRILSYCIMPNHFHLVLFPVNDREKRGQGQFIRIYVV